MQDPPEIAGVLGPLQCTLSVVQAWFLRVVQAWFLRARWTPAARYGGCFFKWSFSPGCLRLCGRVPESGCLVLASQDGP